MTSTAEALYLRSTLGRLFTYSKDSLVSAHENFTTEAVAACIRADPQPMLIALHQLAERKPRLTTKVADASGIRVETQVFLPEGGFLEMVLALRNETGTIGEIWIETKIDSPEGMAKNGVTQLTAYVKSAGDRTTRDGLARDVVALSKMRLQDNVAWLDWRHLYVAAARSPNAWWRDLRLFMEETHVSDAAMLPITDREAGSIADAARLLVKVSEVIRQVNRRAAEFWPTPPIKGKVHWSSEGALLNHVGAVFRQGGRIIQGGSLLRYGAVDFDGTAYWYLAVRSQHGESRRKQLLSKAMDQGLGSDWEPHLEVEEFIGRKTRVASYNEPERAIAWFTEGLAQLQASGLITELAAGTPSTESPVQNDPESPPLSEV